MMYGLETPEVTSTAKLTKTLNHLTSTNGITILRWWATLISQRRSTMLWWSQDKRRLHTLVIHKVQLRCSMDYLTMKLSLHRRFLSLSPWVQSLSSTTANPPWSISSLTYKGYLMLPAILWVFMSSSPLTGSQLELWDFSAALSHHSVSLVFSSYQMRTQALMIKVAPKFT